MKKILRRHAMQYAGLGAASLLGSRFLIGCGDDASATSGSDAGSDAGWQPMAPDPDKVWWLQGNFAPVSKETEALDLEVEGALPPELSGLYVRNGSNPMDLDTGHWFLGDGMLHGVRLEAGKARWYRNRWVQTPILGKGFGGDGTPPGLTSTASNVSVVHHAGKLLSLGEVGLPMEISVADLSTVGFHDYAGKLMTNMTAHPVIDPANGDLLFFGYNWADPFLTYHRANAKGELVQSEPIAIKGPSMMHSFVQTERYVIFMDLPVVFSLDMAVAGAAFPYGWDDTYGARIGVMPKTGTSDDVRWFEIDPCYVFHIMGAHEVADDVVMDVVRYEALWVEGPEDFDRPAHLHRFTMNMATGKATGSQQDDRTIEFPQIDQRRSGRNSRYGYTLNVGMPFAAGVRAEIGGIVKYDRERDSSEVHDFPAWETPGETLFVPASASAGEDEGYLLTFLHDARRDASDFIVMDASDVRRDPIARVKLPVRVPYGFHGHWVPLDGA